MSVLFQMYIPVTLPLRKTSVSNSSGPHIIVFMYVLCCVRLCWQQQEML
jgi:hypothetical protein